MTTRHALVVVGWAVLAPALVLAHGRSVSWSSWTLGPDGAHVELRVAAIDLTLLGFDPWHDTERIAAYAAEHLTLAAGGAACTPTAPPRVREDREGELALAWSLVCASPAPRAIESRLFADVAPSHVHLARVAAMDGSVAERVLTVDTSRWPLAGQASAGFGHYVALGIEHIRTGPGHLAFVLGLLLVAGSLSEVAAIVAAFAVAHSVTLALATLGGVRVEPTAVGAVVALSIAFVAAENAWLLGDRDRVTPWLVTSGLVAAAIFAPRAVRPMTLAGLALFGGCHLGLLARSSRPERLLVLVAFGFGLVHGFGFANVLAELALPNDRLAPALLGFNVGIALAQLAVVAAGWTLLVWLERRRPGARRRVAEIGSAAICGLGLFWFVTRGWG